MRILNIKSLSLLIIQALIVSKVLANGYLGTENAIIYNDIVADASAGIDYRHTATPRENLIDAIRTKPILLASQLSTLPLLPRGSAGVALFDYDRDGDLDIYVTNGPQTDNALYANQFKEQGEVTFVDVASEAGVNAWLPESVGICYGDIDNDGDLDLYVLNSGAENILFENQGYGTFNDISTMSGAGGGVHNRSSCSMGDINGDGLLDIAVANTTVSWDNRIALREEPFRLNEHNQLFLNTGNNTFVDVSETSGFLQLAGFPEENTGAAGITWAIAMVDYDLDGDVDIIMGDDQGPFPQASRGGVDRGLIHIMQNDGMGHFRDVSVEAGVNLAGAWMGLSFGDLNADGQMDLFATNVGDYMVSDDNLPPYSDARLRPFPFPLGILGTRWYLGTQDDTFSDPGVGGLVASVFGWGTVMMDYDNDGDTDIAYGGGLDFGTIYEASPSVILQNDGMGNFAYDVKALVGSTDHSRRNVKGLAQGDLNGDGFVDLVSVSSFDIEAQLTRHKTQWGIDIDEKSFYLPIFLHSNPDELVWTGNSAVDGSLSIELNSADNGNHWVAVDILGTKGLTRKGQVNRDGIGAVVSFTPDGGKTVMNPILGGASFASQNSLTAQFGLGKAAKGMMEVLWPGGVRNRLYNVRASERIVFPEIPCSYDNAMSRGSYKHCVIKALNTLHSEGVITYQEKYRLMSSALRAYAEEHYRQLMTAK